MKMIKRAVIAIIFVTLFVSLFITCSKQSNTIKIGVLLPLTGPIGAGGERVLKGIRLAVQDHNQGEVPKVELVIEDSQGDPAKGVSGFQRLIQITGVKAVIGDLTSGVTLAVAPIAEREHVILLAPGASSPEVRNAGDYIFRNWVSDDFDASVAASYLKSRLGIERVGVLYIQNAYGVGLKDQFVADFENLGGQIVQVETFDQGQSDFRSTIAKMDLSEVGALYVAGQPKEMGFLLRQIVELGADPLIFTNASVEDKEFKTIVGQLPLNVYYSTTSFDLSDTTSYIAHFVEDYQQMFHESPDIASAHGYDAAQMLLQCYPTVDIETNTIRDCLYSLDDFPGVAGNISIDSTGDAIKGVLVKRFLSPDSAVTLEKYAP